MYALLGKVILFCSRLGRIMVGFDRFNFKLLLTFYFVALILNNGER